MDRENAGFSCASYEVIDEEGSLLGRTVHMPSKTSYWGYLTNNYLQTVGILADLEKVEKKAACHAEYEKATRCRNVASGFGCWT